MIRGLREGATKQPAGTTRGMTPPASGPAAVQRQQAIQQYQQAVAAQAKATAEWEAQHVQLDTKEWVERSYYDSLPADQQRLLRTSGTTAFNRQLDRVNAAHTELAPYTKDGQIDVGAAVAAGGHDQALQSVGITSKTIADIRFQQRSQVKVGEGQYMTQAGWSALPAEAQTRIQEVGIEKYNAEVDAENARVDAHNAAVAAVVGKMNDPKYRSGDNYRYSLALADNVVTTDDLVTAGFIKADQKEQAIEDAERDRRTTAALAKLESYKDSRGQYDLQRIYVELPIAPGDIQLVFGPQEGDSEEVKAQKTKAIKDAIAGATVRRMADVEARYSSPAYKNAQIAANAARFYLDVTVPGYATQRHWHEMSNTSRALSIAMDAAMLIPVFGAAGKGARAVTVAEEGGQAAARLARMRGAASAAAGLAVKVDRPASVSQDAWKAMTAAQRLRVGGSLEVGEFWRSVAWPAETLGMVKDLAKPIEVIKLDQAGAPILKDGQPVKQVLTGAEAVAYRTRVAGSTMVERTKAMVSPLETIVGTITGTKLAESSVTTAYHTVKFPLKIFDDPKQAKAARDALMRAAGKPGNHIQLLVGDYVVELHRGELMGKLGGLASGTPMGDSFLTGTIVKTRPGQSWEQQGIFFSFEPLGRFVGETSGGIKGSMPTWIIASPSLAKKMQQGEKTYRHSYEFERILKPGKGLPVEGGRGIPAPAQRLYTRLGDTGQRVELLLPKKLSRLDILELNTKALVGQVKNIFTPSVVVTGRDWRPIKESGLMEWLASVSPQQRKTMLKAMNKGERAALGKAPLADLDRVWDVKEVKAVYQRLVGEDDKLATKWLKYVSKERALNKEDLAVLSKIIGRQDRGLAKNLMTVAQDDGTMLAAARQSAEPPEVFRVRMVNDTGVPRAMVERVERRAGESSYAQVRRADREQARSAERFVSRLQSVRPRARSKAELARAMREMSRRAEASRVTVARDSAPREASPRTEAPRTNAPRTETPRVEAPRVEAPRVEAPRSEVPRLPGPRLRVTGKTGKVILPSTSNGPGRKYPAGSVAFAMGRLGGKTAYWVLSPPTYGVDAGPGVGEGKVFTLDRPEGIPVSRDVTSAYKTIRAMGGKVPESIKGAVGFAPYEVQRGGRKISFHNRKRGGDARLSKA